MTGRPGKRALVLAGLIAAAASAVLLGPKAPPLWIVVAATAALCALVAKQKIQGQTGDILGATQQVCELALLATLCALTLPSSFG